jgi:hypothetical protein
MFLKGLPPRRQRPGEGMRHRLIRMKPEPPQRLAGDVHRDVTVPPAGRIPTAGQIHPDLVVSEWHPVDAANTQSMTQCRLRRPAPGKVLITHDGDPSARSTNP